MKKLIRKWLGLDAAAPAPEPKAPLRVSAMALVLADAAGAIPNGGHEFKAPSLMPGVVPPNVKSCLAMDYAQQTYAYANEYCTGRGFPGYPYLAELTQISEYRSPSETTAMEMTRKWIKVTSHGDGDHADQIEKIEAWLKKHCIRDVFRKAIEHDGYFGRGQIFIDMGATEDGRKNPLIIDPATIKIGSVKAFRVVEALWTTPYAYNSLDPTAKDFYRPTSWYILGKQTHNTRMLTFISRPVPDMLKPAYNFGGISMTQLMEPYVNSWLKTRDSVADLISMFSITGLKTNMSTTLQGGDGADLFNRLALFNKMRDNRGIFAIDIAEEEFFQLNTPLAGLDKLQAQSQEHMAAPSHTPLVKLLGITPAGLGASSEGEQDVYDDYIAAMQANVMEDHLATIIEIAQLDLFGKIDDAIGHEFVPLKQLDGADLATVRKSDADAAVAYITAGVLSPEEERKRLAADPNSGYSSLVPEDVPEPPADPDVKPEDGFDNKDGDD